MEEETKYEVEKKKSEQNLTTGNSPAEIIRMAGSGADLDQLERLISLQERWDANEAKKAYVQAMSRFKENPPKVIKDKQNSQYKSMYTSLGNLVNTVNPELSRQGLSASWDIEQSGAIKVTCRMTHKLGHSESSSASAPADTSGSKNVIQQIKSTITYLKAVTFEAITGLASSDANVDDDGNALGVEVIDDKQFSNIVDLINATKADEERLLKWVGVECLKEIPKKSYQNVIAMLKKKESLQ